MVRRTLLIIMASMLVVNLGYAEGNVLAGKMKSVTCSSCHGVDGNATNSIWPKLAGQHADYLLKEMQDFKQGDKGGRNNPLMYGLLAALSDEDLNDLAAYYANEKFIIGNASAKNAVLGQKIYRGGDRAQGIPACSACHGPAGAGNMLAKFPLLSGQNKDYTISQLKAFRDGTRHNDSNYMMQDIAKKMTDQQIEVVADYIAGLHE